MITVYRILQNGYYGGEEYYADDEGIPFGTTRTPVPKIPEGYYAVWNSTGWTITDIEPPPIQPIIPDVEVVSMRQARRMLLSQGLLSEVDKYIETLPSPQKEEAQIDWEYATEVRKDSNLVKQITIYLNLSQREIDTLFYEASLII